jgi:YggT family protein
VQPFSSIGKMTDPYLRLFRGIIPPLIGFDLSPLLAFIFLTFLIDVLSSIIF